MEPTEQPQALNPMIEDVSFVLASHANSIASFVLAMYRLVEEQGNPITGEPLSKENTLLEGASRYVLIMACSFEDEFTEQINYLIGQNIERDRLIKVKRISKPALDGIRHFTGLRDYRSKVLAHNLRIQRENNRNALRGNFVSSLKVPITLPDYKFLATCIHLCRRVFDKVFPEYERLPADFIREHSSGDLPTGFTTAKMETEVNEIVEKLKRLEVEQ